MSYFLLHDFTHQTLSENISNGIASIAPVHLFFKLILVLRKPKWKIMESNSKCIEDWLKFWVCLLVYLPPVECNYVALIPLIYDLNTHTQFKNHRFGALWISVHYLFSSVSFILWMNLIGNHCQLQQNVQIFSRMSSHWTQGNISHLPPQKLRKGSVFIMIVDVRHQRILIHDVTFSHCISHKSCLPTCKNNRG